MSVWRAIEQALRRSIMSGEYPAGSRLPPDRQIAQSFGTSRMTARRALAELAQQGLIRIEHGAGTFVSSDLVRYTLGERVRFNQNLLATDVKPRRDILKSDEIEAPDDVARALALPAGELVLRIDLLGYANERPISIAARYCDADRFRGLAEAFERTESFTAALRGYGVPDYKRKTTEVTARLPTAREARLLKQARALPVLAWTAVDVDLAGAPVACSTGCFAGERVAFVSEV